MGLFRNLLFRMYWKAEKLIVPGLKSSQYCYYAKLRSLTPGKIWLDLGCGHQVFTEWMLQEQAEVLESCAAVYGIDLDWPGLKAHIGIRNKVMGDLTLLPFEADSIDVVSANMVVEHLSQPADVLREVWRILKPGGAFVFHTPNSRAWAIQLAARIPDVAKKRLIWFFERRREEDVFRTHYCMNSAPEIRERAEEADFTVADITMVSTSAMTVMLGPLVVPELLYIRALQNPKRAGLRSNIVTILRKPVAT